MREIKFKYVLKNTKTGELILSEPITLKSLRRQSGGYIAPSIYIVIGEILFTGLEDKNGVEVFEGDVVVDKFNQKRMIGFLNGSFVIECGSIDITTGEKAKEEIIFVQNREVIGNIYQDSHLLNKAG